MKPCFGTAVASVLSLLCLRCSSSPYPRETPLMTAARQGRIADIQTLISQGADPNARAGVNGWTPILHAIHKHQKESLVALLDGGADNSVSALMMAAGYGYTDMVKTLLDRGADPSQKSCGGSTALDVAVSGVPDIDRFTVGDCQTATVKVLLERAPNLRLSDSFHGRVAGWLACAEVRALLDRTSAPRAARS